VFADFLEEAATLLKRPALRGAAEHFRESAKAWRELALAALPDEVPLLREARAVIDRTHTLFTEEGPAALEEVQALRAKHYELAQSAGGEFPLNSDQAADLCAGLSRHVKAIAAIEKAGVEAVQGGLG
jgi:hypothetical protein